MAVICTYKYDYIGWHSVSFVGAMGKEIPK